MHETGLENVPPPPTPAQGAASVYQRFSLRYLLEILFRRKRTVVLPILIVTSMAAVGGRLMPKRYDSGTTILLGQDEVLNPLVKWQTAVSLSIFDEMLTFTKVIYSRNLLESVAVDLGLVDGLDPLELQDMVYRLQGAISTNVSGTDSFSISAKWDDPEMAKDIAETVTNRFIEKALEAGREEATAAVSFIQDQLTTYRQLLLAAEERLKVYKEENPTRLPEQMITYQGELQSYQRDLAKADVEIKDLELRITLQEDRLSGEQPMVVRSATFLNASPLQTHMERKAIEVAEKRSSMGADHPDLVRAINELEALQAMRSAEKETKEAAQTEEIRSPTYQEVLGTLQELRIELQTALQKREEHKRIIANLEKKVAEIPESQMTLRAMEREVTNLEEVYQTLRAKVEHARVSQQVELQSQANRFKILDEARVPLTHSSPNALLLLIGGFIGGCALGLGLIFLFEFLDQTIVREAEMHFTFGEDVLGTLPRLHGRQAA